MSDNREFSQSSQSGEYLEALAELKQRGCNILVVGEVPRDGHDRVCRNLLGGATETRRRLFVQTGEGEPDYDCRVRSASDDHPYRVISFPDLVRWRVSERRDSGVEEVRTESERLSDIGRLLSNEILELKMSTDENPPAWLRVCFDSLLPLIDNYETEPLFRFLRMLTNGIDDVEGMGHFHLPRPADSPEAELVSPLFDAVTELRLGDGGYEQRWRLGDDETASEWHSL